MKLLAIIGSTRKGKATDTLVEKAIAGAKSKDSNLEAKKIYLIDYKINYCLNCLACRDNKTAEPIADCAIKDDMDKLKIELLNADFLIWGTPLHMGYPTAIMMTFLERICWIFAKPERKILNLSGIPVPRSTKKRRAITIITNGLIPPLYRVFCDNASAAIRTIVKDSLNGKVVGDLYAGDIEHRGVDYYYDKAFRLGRKLIKR